MRPDADKYFDISTPVTRKDGTGATKTFWVRIGAAFYGRDGSVNLKFDSLPLGGITADTAIVLFPKVKGEKGVNPQRRHLGSLGPAPEADDEDPSNPPF